MNTSTLRRFGVETLDETLDEVTLLDALSARIEEMLAYETELLFSTLYRLDVRERDIKVVLADQRQTSIADGLARLVIDRQKEKNAAKAAHRTRPQSSIDDVEFDTH